MILKISVSERGEGIKLEKRQTIFANVIAVQVLENGEKTYFLKGKDLLRSDHWLSTSNFLLNKKQSRFVLKFDCSFEETAGDEVEIISIGQGIVVDVVEVDNFPSL